MWIVNLTASGELAILFFLVALMYPAYRSVSVLIPAPLKALPAALGITPLAALAAVVLLRTLAGSF